MFPFQDVSVIASWLRGQGATWLQALKACNDLVAWCLGQIPDHAAAHPGVRQQAAGPFDKDALAGQLEACAAADPAGVNVKQLLSLLLAIVALLGW